MPSETKLTNTELEELPLQELREEYGKAIEEVDPLAPYEGQEEVWDRSMELWTALESRVDVEQPPCPNCGHRQWAGVPDNPPHCRECGKEVADDELGRAIQDAWSEIIRGEGVEC